MKICAILTLSCSSLLAHTFFEKADAPWGQDAHLALTKRTDETVTPKKSLERACTTSIQFFQNYISAIDGPRSTFYPTSSEYARQMICKYGVWHGIALGCDRLMRENNDPWVYRTIVKHDVIRKLDR